MFLGGGTPAASIRALLHLPTARGSPSAEDNGGCEGGGGGSEAIIGSPTSRGVMKIALSSHTDLEERLSAQFAQRFGKIEL